jgi:hypothetical protein
LDFRFRWPDPICIQLPEREFDLEIAHGMKSHGETVSFAIAWHASVTIAAHDSMAFGDAMEIAGQCRNLMSLLIGDNLSVNSIAIGTDDGAVEEASQKTLQLLYLRRGRHDHRHIRSAEMLLPYEVVKDQFAQIVKRWFARSEQATLAANVFFGSELLDSPNVNVKFLALMQAAESYHRSLRGGLYMDQQAYDGAIADFVSHMPTVIGPDHAESLKNRLKYGNEHSLRKRLSDMLNRIPKDVQLRIAGDVPKFVSKAVDTRNYFTHYDHASQRNAFAGKDAYIAAERVRILLIASLLRDLGIKGGDLLGVLERNNEFQHWTSRDLPV